MYFEEDIAACVETLKNGGTILYPTDTIWGLGCDATNEAAVQKIFRIKKRNEAKSMIIFLPEEKDILRYVNDPNPTVFDFIKESARPVTVIYDNAKNLAPGVINSDGSVGIRIPRDKFCQTLLKAFGKPIVSTSSNISGYPPPGVFSDIDNAIVSKVDYVVRYRQDENVPGVPSTVVKSNNDHTYTIIRP